MIGVKAILAPKIDARAVKKAILKEKRAKGKDIVKELKKTVAGWSGVKPRFQVRVKDRGKDVVIEITLTGTELAVNKWKWLDEGTKRHPIPLSPKVGWGTLWFADTSDAPYKAGSRPGLLVTTKSVESSGPMHAPRQVIHPGFPARKWTEMIHDMMEREFGKRIRIVLKRVIEKKEAH